VISPSSDTINRLPEDFREGDYDHLASLYLGSGKLSFPEACEIFKQIEDQSCYYDLFRRQCYWFCTTFLKRVESKTGMYKKAGSHSKRQGTPGNGYILGGRLKVLNEDRAEMDIQKEYLEQREQARKQEFEAMKTMVTGAMQRSESNQVSEMTRQTIQPLLITTQARREAEVLALRAMFSRIVAQPRPST
jgi:hypothetical protein